MRADNSKERPAVGSPPIAWRWLAVYYAIALLVAMPFNLGWFASAFGTHFEGTPLARWPWLPAALGPAIGAIVARRFGPRLLQTTSVVGSSGSRSLVNGLIPIVMFGFVSPTAALYALVAVLYATAEELGWRGYVADSVAPLRWQWRLLLPAALWWFWHLRFNTTFDLAVFPLIVLLSTLVLAHAARASGSVLVPGAMHALVILLSTSGAPSRPMLIAGGATLGAWILLGSVWPYPAPQAAAIETPVDHSQLPRPSESRAGPI